MGHPIPLWLAAVILSVVFVGCLVLLIVAEKVRKKGIKNSSIAPQETVETGKEEVSVAKEEAKDKAGDKEETVEEKKPEPRRMKPAKPMKEEAT